MSSHPHTEYIGCSQTTSFDPLPETPTVSVIITLYKKEQIPYLEDCIDQLSIQTYGAMEICVLPENKPVIEQTETLYGDNDLIHIHPLPNCNGLSEARNIGAEQANGDIVAFLDVDTIPSEDWVENLVESYVKYDVFAVGGKATPIWEKTKKRPLWLPPEFNWIVGSHHTSFAEPNEIVRNTYGCNISFRRDVFLDLGGYDTDLGKTHGYNLQGEEPMLGLQLQHTYNTGVLYNPHAHIQHIVSPEQQQLVWLMNRAYLQGISKQVINSKISNFDTLLQEENNYLKYLLTTAIYNHLTKALLNFSFREVVFTVMILVYISCVGIGYTYSAIKR